MAPRYAQNGAAALLAVASFVAGGWAAAATEGPAMPAELETLFEAPPVKPKPEVKRRTAARLRHRVHARLHRHT